MVHLTEVQTLTISSGERASTDCSQAQEDGLNYDFLLLNSMPNPVSRSLQPSLQGTWVDFDTKLGAASLPEQNQFHVTLAIGTYPLLWVQQLIFKWGTE